MVCRLYFNTRGHTKRFAQGPLRASLRPCLPLSLSLSLFLCLSINLCHPLCDLEMLPLSITRKSCWAAWARLNEWLSGLPFSGQIQHFANKCECAWPKLNSSSSSSCSNVCYVSFYLVNCRRSSWGWGGQADGLIIAHSPRCLSLLK